VWLDVEEEEEEELRRRRCRPAVTGELQAAAVSPEDRA
jgi:hypothetical protein